MTVLPRPPGVPDPFEKPRIVFGYRKAPREEAPAQGEVPVPEADVGDGPPAAENP